MTELTVAEQQKLGRIREIKKLVNSEEMQKRFESMVGDSKGTYLASILDLYTSDLSNCNPQAVMMECIKAAVLKLPISKALGYAYVVPYRDKPTFIIGYRGLLQLAMRTGQYKTINADAVYEGETVVENRVTGEIQITGTPKDRKNAVGYFAYFEMKSGYRKMLYWSKERVIEHAKKYSKTYNSNSSPWHTEFDEMAKKTLLRNLLSKYGTVSIEFANAMADETDEKVEAEVAEKGNAEELVFDDVNEAIPIEDAEIADAEPGF